jgi:hypothetical protein
MLNANSQVLTIISGMLNPPMRIGYHARKVIVNSLQVESQNNPMKATGPYAAPKLPHYVLGSNIQKLN